jgi:crotonobetainyl-CoA:carnitine CoA-transferase CaiB-like acyl-CoA transferase
MSERNLVEVIAATREGGVPCAQIYSIREIFEDPQYKARGNLLTVDDPRAGEVVLPASVPRLSETPPQFRHAGPALGADTSDVYGSLLGLDAAALRALRKSGAI